MTEVDYPKPANLFKRVHRGWGILTASVILDPIIAWRTPGSLSPSLTLQIAVGCALATLPFLAQGVFHRALHLMRTSQRSAAIEGRKSKAVFVVLGVVALLASSKLVFTQGLQLWPALLLSAFFVVGIIRAVLQMAHQIRRDTEAFIKDPTIQISRWEDQVFVLSLLPMLVARAISLVGALAQSPNNDLIDTHPWFLLSSLLLLGMLRPLPQFYRGFCAKCKQPVSIVVVSLGVCGRCQGH